MRDCYILTFLLRMKNLKILKFENVNFIKFDKTKRGNTTWHFVRELGRRGKVCGLVLEDRMSVQLAVIHTRRTFVSESHLCPLWMLPRTLLPAVPSVTLCPPVTPSAQLCPAQYSLCIVLRFRSPVVSESWLVCLFQRLHHEISYCLVIMNF